MTGIKKETEQSTQSNAASLPRAIYNFTAVYCYASINVKPEGGGGPRAYMGHLTSIAFPTLGNLTKNLGPRVGTFAFFARRNETKSRRPMPRTLISVS